jgi:alkaline phosphatase
MKNRFLFCMTLLLLLKGAALYSQNPPDTSPAPPKTYTHPNPHQPVSIDEVALAQTSEVRNIVLMIGDGMGVSQIFAGMTANRGHLNLEYLKTIGFSKTQSADNYVTDSAAGGTAIAAGVKTNNHTIGLNPENNPVPSILELAEARGLSTGLVATSSVTHATPASFAAHRKLRYMEGAIALDLVDSEVDVLIGGGLQFFSARKDSLNLLDTLVHKGYTIHETLTSLEGVSSGPVIVLLADVELPAFQLRGDMLPRATEAALKILSKNENGFFMMIEGSQIDWGCHNNDPARVVGEMLDFDQTLGVVLEFAIREGNTLIVVTADHETGGVALEGGSITDGTVQMDFTSGDHTGVMAPVFAAGPKAELFRGIYENTEIFHKMKQALEL